MYRAVIQEYGNFFTTILSFNKFHEINCILRIEIPLILFVDYSTLLARYCSYNWYWFIVEWDLSHYYIWFLFTPSIFKRILTIKYCLIHLKDFISFIIFFLQFVLQLFYEDLYFFWGKLFLIFNNFDDFFLFNLILLVVFS
jgi:hypothetical protein